ncbi:FUSC family protein [Actinomadura sp. 7K534]|uniref:FUSC family protein n=1 Tax=Actinomadura sp. 7K534 TaxID=2530366 RepID=UPI00104DCFDF|nr:FUSC family protein [Actinomadura sp. 7K534]TDB99295.1 FUSC family protein [Actinomadura sp. 7K534]
MIAGRMGGLLTRIREQAAPFYGLAAALGIGAPLLAGLLTGRLAQATLAGIGAFLLAFTAPTGPYGTRARSLAVSIVVIALGGAVGGLVAGHRWAAVAAVAVIVPAAVSLSWMRPTAVLAVLLTAVRPPPGHPLENMALMASGGLWLAVLLLVPWPARRLRPLAGSLGGTADAIAALLDFVGGELKNPAPADARDSAWDRHHKRAVTAVRDASTTYRLYRSGEGEDRRSTQPNQLIDAFHRLIWTTVGLHAQLAALTARGGVPDRWRSAAEEAIAALAERARLLSGALTRTHPGAGGRDRAVPRALPSPTATGRDEPEDAVAAAMAGQAGRSIRRLDDTLDSARHILGDGLRLGPRARPRRPRVRPDGWAAAFGGAVRGRSALFRHTARVAVLVTLATAISAALRLPHGQWLPVTVLLSLRDTFRQTLTRVEQRVFGGAAGAAVAAVLLALAPSPPHIVALMTVFAAVGFAVRSVSFALWSVCSTPLVMMLMDLSHLSSWDVALQRIAMVAAGGAIAVVGARLLWPRGAAQEIPARTAELLSADAELTRAAAAVAGGQAPRLPHDRLIAVSAAVDGVAKLRSRLAGEPSSDPDRLDRLDTLVRASRHLRDRLVAVAGAAEHLGGDDPVARILDRAADGIERAAAAEGSPAAARSRLDLAGEFAALDDRIASLTRRGGGAELRRLAAFPHTLGALVDDVNELAAPEVVLVR